MSEIHNRVDEGMKAAMRARNQVALNTLRALKSALKYAALERPEAEREFSELEAIAVVRRELKKRQEAIEQFEQAGRADLAAREREEVALLEQYLPQALSEAEVDVLVAQVIAELGATTRAQMGPVMRTLQQRAGGRVDSRLLSQKVMERLGG